MLTLSMAKKLKNVKTIKECMLYQSNNQILF